MKNCNKETELKFTKSGIEINRSEDDILYIFYHDISRVSEIRYKIFSKGIFSKYIYKYCYFTIYLKDQYEINILSSCTSQKRFYGDWKKKLKDILFHFCLSDKAHKFVCNKKYGIKMEYKRLKALKKQLVERVNINI